MSTIKWGSYRGYEGPYTLGSAKYQVAPYASDDDKILSVITATEGGTYDAVNMYDSCLWSAGLIQWCNRAPQLSVDSLLGAIYADTPQALSPLLDLADTLGYTWSRKGVCNPYRFVEPTGLIVDTVERQRKLYFLGSSGTMGNWSPRQRSWAEQWCAATSEVLRDPRTFYTQLEFTLTKLRTFFAVGSGKDLLNRAPRSSIGGAWSALYLSFAANNPKCAAESIAHASTLTLGKFTEWTAPWLTVMTKSLVTHANIAIYRKRYEKVKPLVERLWGVSLPSIDSADYVDIDVVQRLLLDNGYDLGPKGVDGVLGAKTKSALAQFKKDVASKVDSLSPAELRVFSMNV